MGSFKRDALGLGLRVEHYPEYFEQRPQLDFVEIITENFLGDSAMPAQNLARIAKDYPIVLHGVSLNLMGSEPIDWDYLDQVKALCERIQAPYFTDHLCWTGSHGQSHHDLLPTPYTQDWLEHAAERAAQIQKYVGLPFGIENLSSYVSFKDSTLDESEFYAGVVEQSGCHYMLDINNVYVSAQNHHFDPLAYLDRVDYSKVLQVHLAGHFRRPDGLIIDTHDHPVCDEVWDLYAYAWRRGGPFPTLLEWDDQIPSLEVALAELNKALAVREQQ
jgi:uncharacterized protein